MFSISLHYDITKLHTRTYLINKRQSTILMRHITQLFQRTDGTGHGMNSFKRHDLRNPRITLRKQLLQMSRIVVPEDVLLRPARPNPMDHGSMVSGIGVDDASWQLLTQCKQSSIVGNVTRREEEASLLLVPLGQRVFQSSVVDTS